MERSHGRETIAIQLEYLRACGGANGKTSVIFFGFFIYYTVMQTR
jgi:hypothetical protein